MKKCPFCAEEIQDEAIICRFCQRDIATSPPPPATAPAPSTTPPPPVQTTRIVRGRRLPIGAKVGCPTCNWTVSVGDEACGHCGKPLSWEVTSTAAPASLPSKKGPLLRLATRRWREGLGGGLIVIGFGLCFLNLAGIWALLAGFLILTSGSLGARLSLGLA